jgi:hypothetical protein
MNGQKDEEELPSGGPPTEREWWRYNLCHHSNEKNITSNLNSGITKNQKLNKYPPMLDGSFGIVN